MQAAEVDNCFLNWIGADIRSDPWGYAAPGYPEKAAEIAYRDAYVSHRRNGIYAAMYFSAAISAAFTVNMIRWMRCKSGLRRFRPTVIWRARCAGRWTKRRPIANYRDAAAADRGALSTRWAGRMPSTTLC